MSDARAGLLVGVALTVPVLVELRTILAFVGIDLTVEATAGIGVLLIAAVVVLAVRFDRRDRSRPDADT